jgi:acetolactate synthase-1/2/3 large subunit
MGARAPDQLAALTGTPFFKVSAAENLGATVKQALSLTGPTLVEADMTAIGRYPPYDKWVCWWIKSRR